ncbi:hypothetical protein HHK36_000009 [Tetracentron sinense]|uniref:OTU domain-containing protein n=1 Tax=Tetracentron sinense TaxID=13715 RepID=A0A835A098_TETSI|nr:hypothetical protein HHK36_000009 [Tetracentron sinense]
MVIVIVAPLFYLCIYLLLKNEQLSMSAEISFSDEIEIEPFTGPIEVNVADQFSTNKVFEQRNDLIKWAQEVANGLGFILTIQKSDGLNSRPCPRVFLGYDRSGSYREKQASSTRMKKGIRRSSIKRCGCPFSLKAKKVNGLDQWKVEVVCGVHNHKGSSYLEGHSFAGKLNMEQKKILKDMSRVGIKPRDVLRTIKKKDSTNVTTIRTIYNARAAIRLEELGGKTPIQHLFKCRNDLGYVTFHRMEEKNKNLTDLFFSHPTSVKLSRAFPNVFLLDCTYKTNRFRLPLLSIVGVTSTDRTFFSAFAFLSSETEVSYTWALESFKSVLNPNSLPLVLVTDRELALINAIKTVFPTSKNLLCLWHISKNVLANCKKCFNEEEIFDKFMQDWNALAQSPTEADYNQALMSMTRDFSLYPKVLAYIMLTWLNPYKEFFVSAWTDQYFHIGNTSTSRVESAHAQLKRYLQVSTSNLTTAWQSFDNLINQQHTDIKSSFSVSRIKMPHVYNQIFYRELCGLVSIYALGKIEEQKELAESYQASNMVDAQKCKHVIRRSLGIPCAHELVIYVKEGRSLPLSMIHDHWKRLTLVDESSSKELFKDIAPEFEMIIARYIKSNQHQKVEIKQKLREIADPASIQMKEPVVPVKQRGRPKGSVKRLPKNSKSTKRDPSAFEYVEKIPIRKDKKCTRRMLGFSEIVSCLPVSLSNFIQHAIDVAGDGHCGFRAVAGLMGMGEEGWRKVRIDLAYELQKHREQYANLFGDLQRVCELTKILRCEEVHASPQFWMSMPDMGHLIASYYNVVLLHISKEQCLTFLPLWSQPPTIHKLIALGYIYKNHFVQLYMVENAPIPPIACNWTKYHDPIADNWAAPYASRIKFLTQVIEPETIISEMPKDEASPWLLEPWMDPKNGDTFKSDPDIYSLDADGALFDAALLSAVAAFSHLHIPAVSLNDDGRFVVVSEHGEGKQAKETVNKEKRKLALNCIAFSLTCLLYKKYILADPTTEEESIMETLVTVLLDSSNQLVSLYKPGGPVLAYTSAVKDYIALTRHRVKELQIILNEAICD